MAETKKAEAPRATPAKKAAAAPAPASIPKARQNTEYDSPPEQKAPPTEAEKAAQKASEESAKVEAAAAEKAGKINAALAKKGDSRRVQGSVRHGKPVFHWGNFVPTMELTEDDAAAAEKM